MTGSTVPQWTFHSLMTWRDLWEGKKFRHERRRTYTVCERMETFPSCWLNHMQRVSRSSSCISCSNSFATPSLKLHKSFFKREHFYFFSSYSNKFNSFILVLDVFLQEFSSLSSLMDYIIIISFLSSLLLFELFEKEKIVWIEEEE